MSATNEYNIVFITFYYIDSMQKVVNDVNIRHWLFSSKTLACI